MGTIVNTTLYSLVREGVHKKWDPIGVACYADEMGEYDSYIPALCKLIEGRADREQILEYLWIAETDSMGLEGDKAETENFVDWLQSIKF